MPFENNNQYTKNSEKKSIRLSVFIVTILALVALFSIILTTVIINYEKKVTDLINNQVTDLTLLPSIDVSPDSSTDNIVIVD